MSGGSGAVLQADAVARVFGTGATAVHAVAGVTLEVAAGELVVVRGPSGSGKTTLLNLLGGLDRPSSGRVLVDGRDPAGMGEAELAELRRSTIGYVFQAFALLPVLTAAENVELPLRIARTSVPEREARVAELLARVGLADHAAQRPGELSGGQQQRVGVARALASRPRVLIADEPTGQLDSATAATIMDLIAGVVHEDGVAAVVSTHDDALAARADRVVELRDGRLIG